MIHPGSRTARRAPVIAAPIIASWRIGVIVSLTVGGAPVALANLTDPDQIRNRLADCDAHEQAGDTSTAIDCRWDVFEQSAAFEALAPDEREAQLRELAAELDAKSSRACRQNWQDMGIHAERAVISFEHLVTLYKLECGDERTAECSDAWDQRVDDTMGDYVLALFRRAAIGGGRGDEVGDILAFEMPVSFLSPSLLLTWERSLCSCASGQLGACGRPGSRCTTRISELCQDSNCVDSWCTFGYKLSDFETLPGALTPALRRIDETGTCEGLGEGAP